MFVTVEDIKKHLVIDEEFHDDDEYIQTLIDTAEDAIAKHIDAPLSIVADQEFGGILPPALIHAIKLYVGQLYAVREPVSTVGNTPVTIPFTYEYLLGLYRVYR